MPTAAPALEYRALRPVELRVAPDSREGRIVADVLTYGVVDDYRTTFTAGVFTESLAARMPRICWAHDWHDPIGQWVDADDNERRLRLVGDLDLDMVTDAGGRAGGIPAVPHAHRTWAQLRSGTIDQFSIGFIRLADAPVEGMRGVVAITRGNLEEASPVMTGSVPGTRLVAMRSSARASGGLFSGEARRRRLFPESR